MRWPFVSRKRYEADVKELTGLLERADSDRKELRSDLELYRRQRELEAARADTMEREQREKWQPLMEQIVRLETQRMFGTKGTFQITCHFDAYVMNHVGGSWHEPHWRYLAKQAAYEVERQLATVNFVALQKRADEYAKLREAEQARWVHPYFPEEQA